MAKKTVYMQTASGDVFSTTFPEYHNDCKVLPLDEGVELHRMQEISGLKKWIKPNMTIYPKLESVSGSGMSRRISVYAVRPFSQGALHKSQISRMPSPMPRVTRFPTKAALS